MIAAGLVVKLELPTKRIDSTMIFERVVRDKESVQERTMKFCVIL